MCAVHIKNKFEMHAIVLNKNSFLINICYRTKSTILNDGLRIRIIGFFYDNRFKLQASTTFTSKTCSLLPGYFTFLFFLIGI
jgi:hypothetical protein